VLIPESVGSEEDAQTVAISTLAAESETNLLPGNKLPAAPAAIAPRSPALLGTQPSFAPD